MSQKIKVLIAESSNFSRLVLTNMVQSQPDMEVIEAVTEARSIGSALLKQRPDLILAGLNLNRQGELFYLQQTFQEWQVPVLLLLDESRLNELKALPYDTLGIYDLILLPEHHLFPGIRSLQNEILRKIRAIKGSENGFTFSDKKATNASFIKVKDDQPAGLVVIGASTGGTQAIEKIVSRIDNNLDVCVLIAVHLPAGFTNSFARRLQTLTRLKVLEGKAGTQVIRKKIIIAPGGKNMIVLPKKSRSGYYEIGLSAADNNAYDSPSVDKLMTSVARIGKEKVLGIVLTGMGTDGTKGLKAILENGGTTIAQDQDSSVIFGMPQAAIAHGCVSFVQALNRIPAFINNFITDLPAAAKMQKPGF